MTFRTIRKVEDLKIEMGPGLKAVHDVSCNAIFPVRLMQADIRINLELNDLLPLRDWLDTVLDAEDANAKEGDE